MNNLNSINADFVSQGNQEEVFITCCISGACRWCYQNWKKKSCNNFSGFKLFSNVVELFLPDALLFPLIVPDNCILFSLQLMGWMSSISFWISCFTMLEIRYHVSGFSICISLRDDNSLAAQLQAKNIQVAYWSSLEHPY